MAEHFRQPPRRHVLVGPWHDVRVITNVQAGAELDGASVPGEPIRVLVADDHVLYRRGLELVLGQEPDIIIIGEAGDGAEAIRRAEELLPDVVLMDVRMPRRSGIEACFAIKELVPSTKIVMLTISDEESDLYDAVRAGANGYLLKIGRASCRERV